MRPPRFHVSIKIMVLSGLGAILAVWLVAVPANADFTMPEVPGFSNNYPWFNNVSQSPGNQSFQYFLAYHPNIAQALARNPSLLYDARWRYQFPALEQYLENHPYEWRALSGQDWAEGLPETPWGGYDQQHQWRDAYWWHANNPNWFYDNHQSWASLDSRWLSQDGAYDAQHQWHYGEWWYNQNPVWVTANHPNWLAEHRNWESASERQSYRKQHAMPAQTQQDQRSTTAKRQATNERSNEKNTFQRAPEVNEPRANQQRASEHRQANSHQQENVRQVKETQRQAKRPENPHQPQQAKRERSPETRRQPEPAVRKSDNRREEKATH